MFFLWNFIDNHYKKGCHLGIFPEMNEVFGKGLTSSSQYCNYPCEV